MIRHYAYGLAAAAALTGGVALYYWAADPGPGITGDDIAELMEGVNERAGAIAALPFTGDTGTWWSFTQFTNIAGMPQLNQMHAIMAAVQDLAPSFVQAYTSTGATYWTVTGLWDHLQLGDRTNLYTVGYTPAGAPIYSNAPILTVHTATLWECYRALSVLTTTVANVTWLSGPDHYTNGVLADHYLAYNDGPFTNGTPAPAWFTNFALNGYFESNDFVSGFAMTETGAVVGSIALAPLEEDAYYGYWDAWRLAAYDANTNWTYYGLITNKTWSVTRYVTSGQVAVANLAIGCTSSVEWCMNAGLLVEVQNYGTNGYENYTLTNAFVWSTNWPAETIVHDGVSTSVWDRVSPDTWPRVADLVDPSVYTATGHSDDDVSSYPANLWDYYNRDNWPYLKLRLQVDGFGIVHWTFTRCRPAP